MKIPPVSPVSPVFNDHWKEPDQPRDAKPDQPRDANCVMGECEKCGLELHRIMMYYCPQNDCPTGLGGASSMVDIKV